jgi:cold shock CspA family protein
MKETGIIKCYDFDRAYGFIRCANGRDLFFHKKALSVGCDPADLVRGAAVEFASELDKRSGRFRAVDMQLIPVS